MANTTIYGAGFEPVATLGMRRTIEGLYVTDRADGSVQIGNTTYAGGTNNLFTSGPETVSAMSRKAALTPGPKSPLGVAAAMAEDMRVNRIQVLEGFELTHLPNNGGVRITIQGLLYGRPHSEQETVQLSPYYDRLPNGRYSRNLAEFLEQTRFLMSSPLSQP